MITSEEAQELMTRKRLSGHEAGRIWMTDSLLVERGMPGLMSEKRLRSIGSLLRSQEDMEIYNNYLEIYKRTGFALKDATILVMGAQADLYYLALIIKEYLDRETTSRDREPDFLSTHNRPVNRQVSLEAGISVNRTHAEQSLRRLLAYERRIREISEYTEVDFISIIKRMKDKLRQAIEVYNFYAEDPQIKADKIFLDKIKPDKAIYKYLLQLIPPLLDKEQRDQEASDG